MYNAEVLSKFPVVQHFPFGSLFAWEKDPNAKIIQTSVHTSSQPRSNSSTVPSSTSSTSAYSSPRLQPPQQTQVPLRSPMAAPQQAQAPLRDPMADAGSAMTAAPWAKPAGPNVPSGPNQPTRAPWVTRTPAPPSPAGGGTMAPWAKGAPQSGVAGTRAPWAKK
jgi:serine/threonine-protein phosphatase 2A activator